jgi:hypothetical protein
MQTTFLVDGQEAIPVRAIPFITGGVVLPDLTAEALAQRDYVYESLSTSQLTIFLRMGVSHRYCRRSGMVLRLSLKG